MLKVISLFCPKNSLTLVKAASQIHTTYSFNKFHVNYF